MRATPSAVIDGKPWDTPSMTVGTEATDKINVVVSVKQATHGGQHKVPKLVGWLSGSSTGTPVVATAPSAGTAIKTSGRGTLTEHLADKVFQITLDGNGYADVELSEAGVATFYLVLVQPNGDLVVSGAITFA